MPLPNCASSAENFNGLLTQVLRIVYRTISGDLLRAAGRTRSTAETGAVTLIQRFGSALNLNIHLGGGRLAQQAAGQAPVQRYSPTWMQRLKRVFAIDIETCRRCGGRLKVIASIEEPEVIERILAHLDQAEPAATPFAPRAPPPSAPI